MSGIQIADAVIRLQALDGAWETCGVDRLAGIVPENISCTANEWGSEKASFDLRRDPGGIYPDLTAFTPVDIEVGGTKVWSGRVSSTPSRDGSDSVVNVQCEGWQYHLDDDVYEWTYVETDLSKFVDVRGVPYAPLTSFKRNGAVTSDQNLPVIGFPNGQSVTNGDAVGVTLDLGPVRAAKRVVIHYENQGVAAGTHSLYVKGNDGPWDFITGGENAVGPVDPSSAGSPLAGSFTTVRRWVTILLYKGTAGTATETADRLVRILRVQVFAATAYESGNESVLKASDVVSDALGRATIFLTDTTGVTATSFSIPEYAPDAPRTPREHINAVNAYHAWRTQVTVDRRLIFQAQPSSPLFEAGEWSGCEISDASMNDGDEIYSRVIVEATGPDGVLMRKERFQAQQSPSVLEVSSSPAPDNPSFATNTATWTAGTSTITRDTVTFDTTPAAGRWDNTGASDALDLADSLTETFTGTFLAGVTYTLQFSIRAGAGNANFYVESFGHTASGDFATYPLGSFSPVSTTWTTFTIVWTPSATRTSGVTVKFRPHYYAAGLNFFYIDSLALQTAKPTVVDRRGFRRTKILPVQSALTNAAAQQIADTYLSLHRYTPYRGSLQVTGQGGVRTHQGGQGIHPADLLLYTQEKVRLTNRINPDDGSVGRDGTIASVSYDHNTNTASVELDNRTTNFESFLERLALLTGQVR